MSEPPSSLLWEVTARLVLLSDTHIGPADPAHRSADEPGTDLPVDRFPGTGPLRLRATTLAGLLRHDLASRTGDEGAARELFGSAAGDHPDGPEAPGPAARTGDGRALRGLPGTVASSPHGGADDSGGADLPDGAGRPGALDLDDAEGRTPDHAPVTSRTGNRVDPASGTALPGHLWHREVLPAGTVFTAHLRLHVPAPADEPRLLALLAEAVAGLHGHGPGPHVGARTGRGHGAIGATAWAARRHDLTTAEGWFAHHARTWERRHRDGEEALAGAPPTLAEALNRALEASGVPGVTRALPSGATDHRYRDELRLTLAVGEPDDPLAPERIRPGTLMIADPPPAERAGAVDRAHRHRPVVHPEDTPACGQEDGTSRDLRAEGPPADHRRTGTPRGHRPGAVPAPEAAPAQAPVLGDTALYALFKRIAARLARDVCEALGGHGDLWRHWHAHWWGGDTEAATALPRPSRVRLRRTPVLTGGAPLRTTRLTVDSLFGDAVDGHLSTSDVHCGGTAEAVLDVHEPDDTVRGLLALLVRELATVPTDTLGSGAGTGHGRLTATAATLTIHPGPGRPARTVDLLAAVRDPDSAHARTARSWVARCQARLSPRPVGERRR